VERRIARFDPRTLIAVRINHPQIEKDRRDPDETDCEIQDRVDQGSLAECDEPRIDQVRPRNPGKMEPAYVEEKGVSEPPGLVVVCMD
jgi:hypothetical protein